MSRIVAITGGTRGIGRAVADLFAERGYTVVVCSRSPRDESLPPSIQHVIVDVRKQDDQTHFVNGIVERYGRMDVFVNNAGISRWKAIEDIEPPFVAEIVETNLLGTLWGCSAAARVMSSGACIVNISSLAGKRGSANNSVYCATKFAVNGITQALAKELGPRGIRVNAVCPVYVETGQILDSLRETASPSGSVDAPTYLRNFAMAQTALCRLPTGVEVARAVYFLASSEASAITGQCVNVDCGTLPQ